ncbi:MAG: hypothetical protein R6U40_11325, partial [Desulfobacterales bacterium]
EFAVQLRGFDASKSGAKVGVAAIIAVHLRGYALHPGHDAADLAPQYPVGLEQSQGHEADIQR